MAYLQSRAYLKSVGSIFKVLPNGNEAALAVQFGALGDLDIIAFVQYAGDSGFYSVGSLVEAVQESDLVQQILSSAILANGQSVWNSVSPAGAVAAATWAQIYAGGQYISPVNNQTFSGTQGINQAFQDFVSTHTTAQDEQATDTQWFQGVFEKALQTWLDSALTTPAPTFTNNFLTFPAQQDGIQNAEALGYAQFARVTLSTDPNNPNRLIVGAGPVPQV